MPTDSAPKYKKVLLKVSGEVLMGEQGYGIDMHTVDAVAAAIARVVKGGTEICLVIGGGNIFRGLSTAAADMERASADYMGMLATVMNALAMQNALEKIGVDTRVQSAIPMAADRRALHPPSRRAPHGEGPGGDLRRRHRQPLFHHRHGRRPARRRDGLRRPAEGNFAWTASIPPIRRRTRPRPATTT